MFEQVKKWCLLIIVLYFPPCNGEVVPKKRICIIGAGRAGLAAIKLVADEIDKFDMIAFERNSDVGGLWIYRDNMYMDEHGLPAHSGIYKHLKTNTPKESMVYPDYLQFESQENSNYVSHEIFLDYMKNYTDRFQLRKYIQFDTLVRKVIPIKGYGDWRTTTWRVDLQDLKKFKKSTTHCDAMIVCNGRYSKPNLPSIPGLSETFRGHILHSRAYRVPDPFSNKFIVVSGAGNSGVDIAFDLSGYAKKVYLSHRHDNDPFNGKSPCNVKVVNGVASVDGIQLTLQDNSTILADDIIFCTGYLLEFPFLDESSGIVVEGKKIRSLFQDSLNVEHPSMIIIGLPASTYLGELYYDQVKWFMKVLEGKEALPTHTIMSNVTGQISQIGLSDNYN